MSSEDGTISTNHSPASDLPDNCKPGGSWELWTLAFPLMLSTSFMTIQMFVDRAVLSRYDTDAMGASLHSSLIYWFLFAFLFGTCSYVATFVAQYTGANRPHRVGPAVWQGNLLRRLGRASVFMIVIPFAPTVVSWGKHSADMQKLEITYLQTLCIAGLPGAIVAAISGFFAGRGRSWTVLLINVSRHPRQCVARSWFSSMVGGRSRNGASPGRGWPRLRVPAASALMAFLLLFSGSNRRRVQHPAGLLARTRIVWPTAQIWDAGRAFK